MVSNIWHQLILSRIDRLLRLEVTVWINWACCYFGLSEFALFYNLLLFAEEKLWFFDKLFMLLLLPGQFCLNLWLFLRLLCTWIHRSGWQTGSSGRDLSWPNLLPAFITSCRGHAASGRCYWPLGICPSRLQFNVRTLCKMFFFLKLDFAWLFVTNFVVETIDEINLILLLFRQIFFCFLSLYNRFRMCFWQFPFWRRIWSPSI